MITRLTLQEQHFVSHWDAKCQHFALALEAFGVPLGL